MKTIFHITILQKNRCNVFFCCFNQQGMHFQRNFIYQKSSYRYHIYIGRFHTLRSYSAYSLTRGTNVIRRKKKLIFLIWLIWSKQNKSHSSIGYQPYCDLFFILVIRSFFEINFFFTPLIFFYTSSRLHESDQSIFRKISSFEFRSLKLGKKLV